MLPKSRNCLVVEWDRQQARYAWVQAVGARNTLRAIGTVLAADGESAPQLESHLADIKALLRIKNPELILLVSRREIEECDTNLPLAKGDELAQLVEHQAHEQWPGISDQAIIDYYQMNQGADGMVHISIAALVKDRQAYFEAAAKSVGWRLQGIKLRHLASIQLLQRQVALAASPRSVMLSVSGKDADLVVFSQGQVVFVRTIPLAAESDAPLLAEKLKLEIQRSLLVATPPPNETENTESPIFILGNDVELNELVRTLDMEWPGQIRVVDPFVSFHRIGNQSLESASQYAAVLGAALESNPATTIDFRKPKCGQKNWSGYRRVAVYAVLGCLVLAGLIGSAWQQVNEARQQNAELKRELADVEEQIASLKKRTAIVDYVSQWQRDDINWLEEFRGLSLRMPSRSQTQVRSMSMSTSTGRKGLITMNLRASSEAAIAEFEKSVRDEFHQVRTNQLSQTAQETDFPWQFGAAITVTPRDRQQLAEDRLLADRNAMPPRAILPPVSSQNQPQPSVPEPPISDGEMDNRQQPPEQGSVNDQVQQGGDGFDANERNLGGGQ